MNTQPNLEKPGKIDRLNQKESSTVLVVALSAVVSAVLFSVLWLADVLGIRQ